MNYAEESLRLHREWKGKIRVTSPLSVSNKEELSLAYTPGSLSLALRYRRTRR